MFSNNGDIIHLVAPALMVILTHIWPNAVFNNAEDPVDCK